MPTAGAEIKTGSARVNTGGAAIPFGGLAQGGGGAGGVQLDVKNFCCPEYLTQMVQKIRRNWNASQGAGGQPIVKFTIRRDGMLTERGTREIERPGVAGSRGARAPWYKTMQLPPLPREFPESSLTDSPHIRLSALMTHHTSPALSLLPSSVAVAHRAVGAAAAGHAAAFRSKAR